jgi:hypothetical protein
MVVTVTCTGCGLEQPLVATIQGDASRAAWEAALAVLCPDTAARDVVVRYVDWFAAPARRPQDRTVARVLQDLSERISAGRVERDGITHQVLLADWLDAMRLLVSGQTDAVRPLKTNGYLVGIVWRRAERAAAERERARESDRRQGRRVPTRPQSEPPTDDTEAAARAHRLAVALARGEVDRLDQLLSATPSPVLAEQLQAAQARLTQLQEADNG